MAASLSSAAYKLEDTCKLDAPVTALKYVSPKRAEALEHLQLHTVRDLFLQPPHRYLDYSNVTSIASAKLGEEVTIIGTVDKVQIKKPKRYVIVEVFIEDESGLLRLTFFRQPWIKQQIKEGDQLAVSGVMGFNYGFKTMQSPFFEKLDPEAGLREGAKIYPVHWLSEGLSAQWMRRIIATALQDIPALCDFMPAKTLAALNLMPFWSAIRALHFPRSLTEAEQARCRLAFDELICLQLALQGHDALIGRVSHGISHTLPKDPLSLLENALPFELNQEQKDAVLEIAQDMAAPRPMNRLLLGDVGTGKTAVAAYALALATSSGHQAAVMVPTSVLATQYAEKLGPIFDKANLTWALLTGSTPQSERCVLAEQLAKGEIQVLFGTHAIISESVQFKDLSLVVADEQHRFGVKHRQNLAAKGETVDVLAMTATPIPRTLALSIHGDVEISRIKERPVAGAGLDTKVVSYTNIDLAYQAINKQLEEGHQVYVVCTRIDEDDPSQGDVTFEEETEKKAEERQLYSVAFMQDFLSKRVFPGRRIGVLTGHMAAQEKDDVMAKFRKGLIDILIATTVIEVGVDVPNATALLVMDADRFGLATLHQLRGRVGRGKDRGTVFLASPYELLRKDEPPASLRRLQALERTTDGEELAKLDLRMRHEGDLLGYRQSGEHLLKIADLVTDEDLVDMAHRLVRTLLQKDPELISPLHQALKAETIQRYHHMLDKALS